MISNKVSYLWSHIYCHIVVNHETGVQLFSVHVWKSTSLFLCVFILFLLLSFDCFWFSRIPWIFLQLFCTKAVSIKSGFLFYVLLSLQSMWCAKLLSIYITTAFIAWSSIDLRIKSFPSKWLVCYFPWHLCAFFFVICKNCKINKEKNRGGNRRWEFTMFNYWFAKKANNKLPSIKHKSN